MKIEVSIGEIVDKLSILQLKSMHIEDGDKLKHILIEAAYLEGVVKKLNVDIWYYNALLSFNNMLWQAEDEIRAKGLNSEFDNHFIELSKRIYTANDTRSLIKNKINIKYKSKFVEQKSYKK
jgi:hypothetical protein